MNGTLTPFVDAYEKKLKERGYAPLSIVDDLRQVAHLSRWLEEHQLTGADLTSERLEQFLALRRERRGHRGCSMQGLVLLLEVLDEQGAGRLASDEATVSAGDVLMAAFERFLIEERAVAASTAACYVARAGRFVAWFAPTCGFAELQAKDVTEAVLRESATLSVSATQLFATALRSFLRFCFIEGLTPSDLSAAALPVTGRRHSWLPKGITESAAEAILRSCDRRQSKGRRDYAILLVLLRLGLRASEVAGLRLEDIDWRAGEIVVHGKGRREDRLPLPVEVGEAIVGYLRRGRPRSTSHREVFLRALAPIGPLTGNGISAVVWTACSRAGVPPVRAHRLRHTVACRMVNAGVPLSEIGEVLRHRSTSSWSVYARVDLERLRAVAQPWPGGEAR
jgi:site-specific recombinase XerD